MCSKMNKAQVIYALNFCNYIDHDLANPNQIENHENNMMPRNFSLLVFLQILQT